MARQQLPADFTGTETSFIPGGAPTYSEGLISSSECPSWVRPDGSCPGSTRLGGQTRSRASVRSRPLGAGRKGLRVSHSFMSGSLQPVDCSPPGSSVHGILQARILEWVAISFSRGSSRPRDRTCVSYIAGGLLHYRWILY